MATVKVEPIRYVNPQKVRTRRAASGAARRKSKAAHKTRRARKNPALAALGPLNPERRFMTKKKKGSRKAKRHGNPFGSGKKNRRGGRRHGNPAMLSGAGSILKDGFYALIGLVIARQAPQLVLGARNTGPVGYVANVIATVIAAMVGSKLLGPPAGRMLAVGGGLYVVNRVIQDNFTPIGRVLSLSGYGDPHALAGIEQGYFPLPVPTNASGQPIIPAQLQPPPAAAAANGRGLSGGFPASRFQSRF